MPNVNVNSFTMHLNSEDNELMTQGGLDKKKFLDHQKMLSSINRGS
jgi:hypothetical protein